jgi:hypothetical protein
MDYLYLQAAMSGASEDTNKNGPSGGPSVYSPSGVLHNTTRNTVCAPVARHESISSISGSSQPMFGAQMPDMAHPAAAALLYASSPAANPKKSLSGALSLSAGSAAASTRTDLSNHSVRSPITASYDHPDRSVSLSHRAPAYSAPAEVVETVRNMLVSSVPVDSFIDEDVHETAAHTASATVPHYERESFDHSVHMSGIPEGSEYLDDAVTPVSVPEVSSSTYTTRAYSVGFGSRGIYHDHARTTHPVPTYTAAGSTADALKQLSEANSSVCAALQTELNKADGLAMQVEYLRAQLSTAVQTQAMLESRIKEKSAEQLQSEERLTYTIMELKEQVNGQLAELKTHRNLLAAADAAIPGFEQTNEYFKRFTAFHAGNKSGSLMSCVDAKDGDLCSLTTLDEVGSREQATDPLKLALVLNLLFSCAVSEAAEALRVHQAKVAQLFGAASDAPADVEPIIRAPLMIRAWLNMCRRQFARVFDFRAIGVSAFESWLHDLPEGLEHRQFKDLPTSMPSLYEKLVRLAAEVAYLTLWCEVSDAEFRVAVPLSFDSLTGTIAPIHVPYSTDLRLVEIESRYRKTDGGYPVTLLLRPREAGTFPQVSLRASFVGEAFAVSHASLSGPLSDLNAARIGYVACPAPVRESPPPVEPVAVPIASTADAPVISSAVHASSTATADAAPAYARGVLHSEVMHTRSDDITKSAPAHVGRHRDSPFGATAPAEVKIESESKVSNADTYASSKDYGYHHASTHASGHAVDVYSANSWDSLHDVSPHIRNSRLEARIQRLAAAGEAQPQFYARYSKPMLVVMSDGRSGVYHPPSQHVILQGKYDEIVREGLVDDYARL